MTREITTHLAGGVAVLTLAAGERRNALTPRMARELTAACDALDAAPDIGAVVVRGEGGYFCAGGDRATLAEARNDPAASGSYDALSAIYRSFARVGSLALPTIAAVRGGAVGAGVNLMMATDLRIVAREAQIASGFLALGIHAGGGHAALLGRTGAREAVAALTLFGERVDGETAARLGLAWRAVDDEDVEDIALELAARAGADPELARRSAASLRTSLGPPPLPWAAALEMERASQMWSLRRKAGAP